MWKDIFNTYKKRGDTTEVMTAKLNKLLVRNQITQEEYDEILELINNVA